VPTTTPRGCARNAGWSCCGPATWWPRAPASRRPGRPGAPCGLPWSRRFAEAALGEVSRHAGEPARARSLLTTARRRLEEASGVPPRVRLLPLTGLARLAVAGGRPAEARGFLAEALVLALAAEPPLVQDRPAIAGVTEALADLALADGRPADAACLLGYAAAVRGAPDQGNPDVRRAERAARAALGHGYDGLHVQAGNKSAEAAITELAALAGQLTGGRFG
jgi:hypothetical protein